jgi:hypothetical protein
MLRKTGLAFSLELRLRSIGLSLAAFSDGWASIHGLHCRPRDSIGRGTGSRGHVGFPCRRCTIGPARSAQDSHRPPLSVKKGDAVLQSQFLAVTCALLILSGSGSWAANADQGATGLSIHDTALGPRLEQCPFKRWAPINAVKEFYGLTDDPIEEPSPVARAPLWKRSPYIGSTYYYQLPQYGVVVRFGSDLQMLEIGVRRPFSGKIGGVPIGATKDDVRRLRGETSNVDANSRNPSFLKLQRDARAKVLDRLSDPASHNEIRKTVEEIGSAGRFPIELMIFLRRLPDPAPREAVREALEKVTIIDKASLKYTTDWSYYVAGGAMHIHFHFGSDDTVDAIFASSCDVE